MEETPKTQKPYIENVRVVSAPEGRACEFLIAFPQPTRHDYRIVFYRQRTTGEFAKWLFLKELSPSRVTRLSRGRDKTISDETLNVLSLRSRPRDISIVARGALRPALAHQCQPANYSAAEIPWSEVFARSKLRLESCGPEQLDPLSPTRGVATK